MKLKVTRELSLPHCTLGKMYVDDKFFAYTLEDIVRAPGLKIYGETAIPEGEYKVELTMSNHFQRVTPQILNVPGFEGIRIHGGNTAADTLGCILIAHNEDISHERIQGTAEPELTKLLEGIKDITIEIKDVVAKPVS